MGGGVLGEALLPSSDAATHRAQPRQLAQLHAFGLATL
jgi:hypothetical protein